MLSCFLFPEGKSPPHRPNSPGRCAVEGKYGRPKSEHELDEFSQSVATIATFASIQSERHSGLHTYTFPMLWVGKEGVMVLFYNKAYDILMMSKVISWDGYEVFAVIWSAVNHSILPILDLSRYKEFKCGLRAKFDEYRDTFRETYYLASPAVCRGRSRPKLPK